eukprot:Amastigsp_a842616_2.p3 type:complete len:115 gc:universal Amastigsp_a842616_2:183-527(+)
MTLAPARRTLCCCSTTRGSLWFSPCSQAAAWTARSSFESAACPALNAQARALYTTRRAMSSTRNSPRTWLWMRRTGGCLLSSARKARDARSCSDASSLSRTAWPATSPLTARST